MEKARNRCEHERGNFRMMDGEAMIDSPKNSKEIQTRKKDKAGADLRGHDLYIVGKMTPYSRGVWAFLFLKNEKEWRLFKLWFKFTTGQRCQRVTDAQLILSHGHRFVITAETSHHFFNLLLAVQESSGPRSQLWMACLTFQFTRIKMSNPVQFRMLIKEIKHMLLRFCR